MTIYLAGPITGLSYEEVVSRIERLQKELKKAGYDVIHPMIGKKCLQNETKFKPSGYTHPITSDHSIVRRDHWMVINSDILFLDFTQGKSNVSIGSICELAWAYHNNVYTVVVLPKDNVHNHAFVKEMSDVIFTNIDEAIEYLIKLSKRKM